MNIATLKMPRLGETMQQGEIVTWLVRVGQAFQRGEAILEVETDKTVVEYPALGGGVLVEILANQGDTVDVGEAIARIDLGTSGDWTGADASEPMPEIPHETSAQAGRTVAAKAAGRGDGRPRATPLARGLARRAGIDLRLLAGTGRRGRIEAHDVRKATGDAPADQIRFAHDIAYRASGPDSGPQFLLLHGFGGDHKGFAQLANGLKHAGARVVTCDLPGHGATGIEARTADALATNLAPFADQVLAGRPFHLVAHSLGAVPALALAPLCNPASLSLIAPVGLSGKINLEFLTGMAAPGSPQEVRRLLNLLTRTPGNLTDAAINDIFADLSRGRLLQLARDLGQPRRSILAELEQVARTVPVRLLIARDDQIVGAPVLEGLAPQVALHFFADTGHMPHWENPQAVLQILLSPLTDNTNR